MEVDHKKVAIAFEKQTGYDKSDVTEIVEAFPMSMTGHIHTDSRTFMFKLTPDGRVKKNSFIEQK